MNQQSGRVGLSGPPPAFGPQFGVRQMSKGRPFSAALIVVFGSLLAVFFGLAAAVLPPHLLGIGAAAILGPLLFAVWLTGRATNSRNWIFVLLLVGLLVLPFLGRVTGFNFGTGWQLLVLLAGLLGLRRFWADVRMSSWLQLGLAAFAGFMILAIISTVLGHSKWSAAAFQFASNFKPLLLIALGYALLWDERSERWLSAVLAWAWLPMAAMVAFEWAAPGAFHAMARSAALIAIDSTSLFPSRAIGIFEHPSHLAAMAACFALLVFSRWLCAESRQWRHLLLVAVYGGLVVCAVQRQEFVALVVGLLIILAVREPRHLWRNAAFLGAGLVLLLVALWLAAPSVITDELAKWGYGTVGPIDRPRAQIFLGGWYLAQTNFPFGAGLGTFAGAGAEKFDLSVYSQLGFGRYWWFGKKDFLLDTYWPNSLAESGMFGAALLLTFYLALLAFGLVLVRRAADARSRAFAVAACGSMVYILLVSLTSPAFQDPRLFAIPAVLFGISSTISGRLRDASSH